MTSTITPGAWVAIGAVGLVALYLTGRNAGVVASTVVNAAGDAAAGTVLGAGDVLGIPRTNESQCDKDLKAGEMWAASFSCPASRFVSSATSGLGQAVGGVWDSAAGLFDTGRASPPTWGREVRETSDGLGVTGSW